VSSLQMQLARYLLLRRVLRFVFSHFFIVLHSFFFVRVLCSVVSVVGNSYFTVGAARRVGFLYAERTG